MDKKEFENKLRANRRNSWEVGEIDLLEYCYEDLTTKQKNIAFKTAIKNNIGHALLKYCYENLTKEQKDIAFDNTINNHEAGFLSEYCLSKLTEEQINMIKLKKKEIGETKCL